MFRVLTISREFGSGGGQIARRAAERLGWKLLDQDLIEAIARAARVDPDLARRFDERVDSWIHRISRVSLWRGGLEGVAEVDDSTVFDCQAMAALATSLIREAHKQGQCVVVGRGAQCILQQETDTFHAYIYAPLQDRVRRVRERAPAGTNAEELIRTTDQRRGDYVRLLFNARRDDPHLYHIMLCSSIGEEAAVDAIVRAMDMGR